MKVEIEEAKDCIPACRLEPGEAGAATTGAVVLMTEDCLVNISAGITVSKDATFPVHKLPPGTRIILTVE